MYHFLPSATSTNDVAKQIVQECPGVPAVVVARTQTKGRGSGDRVWYSASAEGLYYSYLGYPQLTSEEAQALVAIAGEKVVSVIQKMTGLMAEMEWPNDIILNQKKVGGILIEAGVGTLSPLVKYAIVGIGLNLNQLTFPDELRHSAISLRQVSQIEYPKYPVIQSLTQELDHVFARY